MAQAPPDAAAMATRDACNNYDGDGDAKTAAEILPLVYERLRCLARQKLGAEPPGQTLQATSLVHEAYVRLVGGSTTPRTWHGRWHFFSAAAESMRRILIEHARR